VARLPAPRRAPPAGGPRPQAGRACDANTSSTCHVTAIWCTQKWSGHPDLGFRVHQIVVTSSLATSLLSHVTARARTTLEASSLLFYVKTGRLWRARALHLPLRAEGGGVCAAALGTPPGACAMSSLVLQPHGGAHVLRGPLEEYRKLPLFRSKVLDGTPEAEAHFLKSRHRAALRRHRALRHRPTRLPPCARLCKRLCAQPNPPSGARGGSKPRCGRRRSS
jgi:hypothetical protein